MAKCKVASIFKFNYSTLGIFNSQSRTKTFNGWMLPHTLRTRDRWRWVSPIFTCFSRGDEGGRAGQTTADGADGHDVELVFGERVESLHRVVVGLEADHFRRLRGRRQFRLVLDHKLDGLARRPVVVPADVHRSGRYLGNADVGRRVRQF